MDAVILSQQLVNILGGADYSTAHTALKIAQLMVDHQAYIKASEASLQQLHSSD